MLLFLVEVVVSVVYAFANLVVGWSGVALLIGGLAGAQPANVRRLGARV